MDEKLQVQAGDVVTLKSGGPSMVVEAWSDSHAYCTWFEGEVHKSANFPLAGLMPASAPTDKPE